MDGGRAVVCANGQVKRADIRIVLALEGGAGIVVEAGFIPMTMEPLEVTSLLKVSRP